MNIGIMIYLRPTPPRDGVLDVFFSAGLVAGLVAVLPAAAVRLSETGFDVLFDFPAGLFAAVGAPCGLEVSPAAIRFAKLLGLRVSTPPGKREDSPPPPATPPRPCAILSAAVFP
jgi:hypothetical protein